MAASISSFPRFFFVKSHRVTIIPSSIRFQVPVQPRTSHATMDSAYRCAGGATRRPIVRTGPMRAASAVSIQWVSHFSQSPIPDPSWPGFPLGTLAVGDCFIIGLTVRLAHSPGCVPSNDRWAVCVCVSRTKNSPQIHGQKDRPLIQPRNQNGAVANAISWQTIFGASRKIRKLKARLRGL